MGAVSVFMIGSSANLEDVDGVSFLLKVVVATVAFFVVVLRLSAPCFLSIDIVITTTKMK